MSASMPGFTVTSPDLVKLSTRMKALDIGDVYRDAANKLALDDLEPRIARAAVQAGVSGELLDVLGTYTDAHNEVYVGVPASHPSHEEAVAAEYGTLFRRPADFMRGTVASRQRALNTSFADYLTKSLRAAL